MVDMNDGNEPVSAPSRDELDKTPGAGDELYDNGRWMNHGRSTERGPGLESSYMQQR